MSGGGATRLKSKPRDVHSTDAERPNSKHLKNDKRAYAQVYLARARIEGIERWRAAVDLALQAADEDCEEQETNINLRRTEEDTEQKTEGTRDIEVEVLEQAVCCQLLTVSFFLLTSLLADRHGGRCEAEAPW